MRNYFRHLLPFTGYTLLVLGTVGCGAYRCPSGQCQPGGPVNSQETVHSPALTSVAQHGALPEPAQILQQKVTALEEEKTGLAHRLAILQRQLEERDKSLLEASREIQAAHAEMTRTHTKLQQWKQQMANLQDQWSSSEKQNVAALQTIVHSLEKIAAKEKGE